MWVEWTSYLSTVRQRVVHCPCSRLISYRRRSSGKSFSFLSERWSYSYAPSNSLYNILIDKTVTVWLRSLLAIEAVVCLVLLLYITIFRGGVSIRSLCLLPLKMDFSQYPLTISQKAFRFAEQTEIHRCQYSLFHGAWFYLGIPLFWPSSGVYRRCTGSSY